MTNIKGEEEQQDITMMNDTFTSCLQQEMTDLPTSCLQMFENFGTEEKPDTADLVPDCEKKYLLHHVADDKSQVSNETVNLFPQIVNQPVCEIKTNSVKAEEIKQDQDDCENNNITSEEPTDSKSLLQHVQDKFICPQTGCRKVFESKHKLVYHVSKDHVLKAVHMCPQSTSEISRPNTAAMESITTIKVADAPQDLTHTTDTPTSCPQQDMRSIPTSCPPRNMTDRSTSCLQQDTTDTSTSCVQQGTSGISTSCLQMHDNNDTNKKTGKNHVLNDTVNLALQHVQGVSPTVCGIETNSVAHEVLMPVQHNIRSSNGKCLERNHFDTGKDLSSNNHDVNKHDKVCMESRDVCSFEGCGKNLKTKQTLHNHEKFVYTDVRNFVCNINNCGKRYKLNEELKIHQELHEDISYICPEENCGKVFKCLQNQQSHIRLVHIEQRYICHEENCQKVYKTMGALRYHELSHQRKNEECKEIGSGYVCSFEGCGKTLKTKQGLDIHIKCIHINVRNYVCDINNCGKRYKSQAHLDAHQELHAGITYTCSEENCGKVFKSSHNLHSHLRQAHAQRRYQCLEEGCQKTFRILAALRRHTVTHEDRTFYCQENGCHRTFQNPSSLFNHEKNIHVRGEQDFCPEGDCMEKGNANHGKTVQKEYVCVYEGCGKTFSNVNEFYQHHRLQGHWFVCPVVECGKTYHSQIRVKNHINYCHQKELELCKCQEAECNVIFKTTKELRRHLRVHATEKNYLCDICGKRFKTREYFRHRNNHEVLKRSREFICPHTGCSKAFRSNKHLRVHVSNCHVKKSLHKCPQPGYEKFYVYRFLLETHLFSHILKSYETI